jgi:hypothetical protein
VTVHAKRRKLAASRNPKEELRLDRINRKSRAEAQQKLKRAVVIVYETPWYWTPSRQ